MHPQTINILADQHYRELMASARERRLAAGPRGAGRRIPRWHVNWSRTTLVPDGPDGPEGRRERAWVIIISASRSA